MSLIVVEGCDGSGKSTLLENARIEIKKRYFLQTRHSCRPLELGDALHFMRTARYTAGLLPLMVDRHPLISEPIYGPILRGSHLFESHLNLSRPHFRYEELRDSVTRIIYCRPSLEAVRRNISVQPQLAGIAEKIDLLYEAYDRTMEELSTYVQIVMYDYQLQTTPLEQLFFGDV